MIFHTSTWEYLCNVVSGFGSSAYPVFALYLYHTENCFKNPLKIIKFWGKNHAETKTSFPFELENGVYAFFEEICTQV